MKNLKKTIAITAMAAFSTVAGYAVTYSVSVSGDHNSVGTAENITLGQTATFNMVATATEGGNQNYSVENTTPTTVRIWNGLTSAWDLITPVNSPVINLADGALISTSGTSYTVTWVPTSLGLFRLNNWLATGTASSSTFTYLNVTDPAAVPEPAQVVASGMLLGCGGLIFVARRAQKKRLA